jgi:hypothetical protein
MVTQIVNNVHVRVAVALTLIAFAMGCGEKLNKVPVQGIVTFNGKKVLNGDIRFMPEEGVIGTALVAPIVNGEFHANSKGGLSLGEHRVILRAFIIEDVGAAAAGGDGDLLDPGTRNPRNMSVPVYMFEGREQFLPPEYNARAGLTINVTGEQNPQIEDFNLRDSKT